MDRLESLERLAKLRETGVLTESEYLQEKNRLFSEKSIVPRPISIESSFNRSRQAEWDGASIDQYPRDAVPQIHIHNTNSQHNPAPIYYARTEKSVAVGYLLWLFLGGLGGHRFYLGRPGTAIMLLMLSVIGLSIDGLGVIFLAVVAFWLFIDLFLIPGMANERVRMVVG